MSRHASPTPCHDNICLEGLCTMIGNAGRLFISVTILTLHFHVSIFDQVLPEQWYSNVLRYQRSSDPKARRNTAPELSRKVLEWVSFGIWSDHNIVTKNTTFMIWRCPLVLKQLFYSKFQGPEGSELHDHPMLAHAFFMEYVIMHTYDFLEKFSEPLYNWVHTSAGHSKCDWNC